MTTNATIRLATVRERIALACAAAGRPVDSVRLLVVSKTFPAAAVAQVAAAGHDDFGENYLQEALAKMDDAEHRAGRSLRWHFIGPLQSNKTAAIAVRFDWVHSIERLNIAQRLSAQRPAELPPLDVCVQVNVSGEPSKSGCMPADTAALCAAVAELPRLRLRGLMCIPRAANAPQAARPAFHALRTLFEKLRANGNLGPNFDTLSMGMSGDFETAIAERATIVRIGSAIFGARTKTTSS